MLIFTFAALGRFLTATGCGIAAIACAAGPISGASDSRTAPALTEAVSARAAAFSFQLVEHRRAARERMSPSQRTTSSQDLRHSLPRERLTSSNARGQVLTFIRAAELRHGLPAGLLDALVAIESSYQPFAVSRAGAAGLTQLIPGTAKDLGVTDRFDIRSNLEGGARYLRSMLDRFGSVALALAAYNAGPNTVARSRAIPRNGETPAYVARVIARWREIMENSGR